MPSLVPLRHVLAVCLLPGTVAVLVPALIVWRTDAVSVGWGLSGALAIVPVALGVAFVTIGAALVA